MSDHFKAIDSKVIHAGELMPRPFGAVTLPVFQSSTFENSGDESYHDLRYIRLNNTPNHVVLGNKLARLENAEAGLVAASGMAAITTTLLSFLSAGDHLLIQRGLYGGTHDFVTQDLPRFGISHTMLQASDPESWEAAVTEKTRCVLVETISNPLVEVIDLQAVVEFSRRHGLVSMIDNTFASPVNFRPAEWGFDLSLHSATKYLNGHSDIVAGVVIGKSAYVNRVRHLLNHLGGSLDPHACYLLHRGLKTLPLRVRQQNETALSLARSLVSHPAISKVNYPGLEESPGHGNARRFLDGFGGMLSFEPVGGLEAADHLLRRLEIPLVAPSLGGVETLITRPSKTSHAGMEKRERLELGVRDRLVRVSVGVESAEDLMADFKQALDSLHEAPASSRS